MNDTVKLFVTPEGTVDFAHVPTEALIEVATKHLLDTTERQVIVSQLRDHLLRSEGDALLAVLCDLRAAAVRYGDETSVVLTIKN